MSIRSQIVTVLSLLAAPAAALATPVSAGQVEALMRSEAVTPPAIGATAPAAAPTASTSTSATEYARRVHELVVGGASYNEAPAAAAQQEPTPGATSAPAQPTRHEVEEGSGYTPSSYASAAPTRG